MCVFYDAISARIVATDSDVIDMIVFQKIFKSWDECGTLAIGCDQFLHLDWTIECIVFLNSGQRFGNILELDIGQLYGCIM
jgi:hypothetical protein